MSKYPVGARWKGIEKKTGKIGYIWLNSRDENTGLEVWQWRCMYSDGSYPMYWFDWNTSYRACKDELPVNCKMKRVKKQEN